MDKWKVAMVGIDQLEETKENANKMTKEEFDRLVENIILTGGLSSAIGCYRRASDGKFVIFSGNHRKRAAEKARLRVVPVVYSEEEDLDEDETIALQLSHNSLHGEDDKGILKRLFEQIQKVDFKKAAFINIDEVVQVDTKGISFSMESEHYSVSLILYRKDFKLLEELLGIVNEEQVKSDLVVLADGGSTEEFYLKLASEVRAKYDIHSTNIAFCKMLELAKQKMDEDV